MNNVSVIIPTISRGFDSDFINQIKLIKPLEIIIVGNDLDRDIADKLIKLHETKNKNNAATNRNLGASKAIGDYLLFIDDDVVVDHEYIINNLVNKDVKHDLVHGRYSKLAVDESFLNYYQNQFIIHRVLKCNILCSSHFFIKKDVFKSLGGFNEELDTYEDIEFWNRCTQEKIDIHFDSQFLGKHLKRFSLTGLIKDYFVKVSNSIFAKRKYKFIFKNETLDLTSKINLLLFPVYATISVILFVLNLTNTEYSALLSTIYLIGNYYIFRKLFKLTSLPFFVKSLFLSIVLSTTTVFAVFFSYTYSYLVYIYRTSISLFDYLRMLKRVILRNGYPIQIVHYVTARCNLRCSHCFYKETLDKKDSGEQPLEIFRKTSRQIGPVLWYALAGGEVFVRKDFVELFSIIIDECRPKYISIPTNGWYTERTFKLINRTLMKYPDIFFSLYFSIDGYEETHDLIRGKNSFANLKNTYFKLKKLQAYYKNFNLNIVTTITPQNHMDSDKFIEYVSKEFSPNTVSINLFRYHSLKHPKIPLYLIESYNRAFEKYFSLLDEKQFSGLNNMFRQVFTYKDKIQKFIITKVAKYDEFVTPCTAGNLSYVIMEDGRVKPCEILDDSIGNVITDHNISDIFRSKRAKELRRRITKTECKCTYECAMSTNALFSWPMTKKYFGLLLGDKLKSPIA